MAIVSPWLTAPRLVSEADAQRTSVIRREGFLSPHEIQQVHTAAAAVALAHGEEDLAKRQKCAPGSWKTVFLNQRLTEMLPDLAARLWDAVRTADRDHWGLLDEARQQISFRVCEYHTVLPNGGLPTTTHSDWGSLITMDILLSDTSTFEGGELRTREPDGRLTTHAFEAGDLLLFQSHKHHHVTPLTLGRRNVLVVEVWEGLPRCCPARCTDPWGPCECRYRQPPAPLYRRTDPAHFCRRSSSFGLGSGWRNEGYGAQYGAADADAAPAGQAAEAAAAVARRAAMQVAAHIAELEADEARAEWRLGDGKKL